MENTTFLAQMWGPAMLAVGLGIFVSRKYYIKLYHDLQNESLAVLIFGMAGMAAGIAQITYHNVWETFPQIVMSLLGWGLLLKGAVFAIVPGFVDRAGDWEADSKLVPLAAVGLLIIGAYVSWVGFFM